MSCGRSRKKEGRVEFREEERRFHTFILQVQASRRECVSSAAFLCYRASAKEKVEGTERERERMGGERVREWEVLDLDQQQGQGQGLAGYVSCSCQIQCRAT